MDHETHGWGVHCYSCECVACGPCGLATSYGSGTSVYRKGSSWGLFLDVGFGVLPAQLVGEGSVQGTPVRVDVVGGDVRAPWVVLERAVVRVFAGEYDVGVQFVGCVGVVLAPG